MGNTETGVQEWYVQADNFSTYAKGKDGFSKGKTRASSHKPRVFGPDGIKDL